MSCGVGCSHGSDPVLLWLWCRLAATALIRPLAWEPPYALGAALQKAKTHTQKNNNNVNERESEIQMLIEDGVMVHPCPLPCVLQCLCRGCIHPLPTKGGLTS